MTAPTRPQGVLSVRESRSRPRLSDRPLKAELDSALSQRNDLDRVATLRAEYRDDAEAGVLARVGSDLLVATGRARRLLAKFRWAGKREAESGHFDSAADLAAMPLGRCSLATAASTSLPAEAATSSGRCSSGEAATFRQRYE
jgi:hypothetical protein